MENHSAYYTFFDVNTEFRTNCPSVLEEYDKHFGYFKVTSRPDYIHVHNCITQRNKKYFVKSESKRYSASCTVEGCLHADNLLSLFNPVIHEVKDFFLLHGSSLCSMSGKHVIISAPSGFGKTTIAKELTKNGFLFLSDELAPLNLNTGLIHPYPRGMSVRMNGDKLISTIPADIIGKACNPAFAILLSLEKISDNNRYFEIALSRIDDNIISAFKQLKQTPTIELLHDRIFPVIRMLVQDDAELSYDIERLCKLFNVSIIYMQRGRTEPPDFNAEPRLEEVSQKDGIFELSNNLLNAHNSALIDESFSGSTPKMIFELAGLTQNVKYFTLTVGKLDKMAERIKKVAQ
jgi:hypothetical protein